MNEKKYDLPIISSFTLILYLAPRSSSPEQPLIPCPLNRTTSSVFQLPHSSLQDGLALGVKGPRVAVNVHRFVELAQLRRRPGIILDQSPFNRSSKVFLCVYVCMSELIITYWSWGGGKSKNRTPYLTRTLKFSVKIRWASLNSGVEKERRGSSFLRISCSCGE